MGDVTAALTRLLAGQGQFVEHQVRDVHRAVADRVFGRLGPVAAPVRSLHDVIADRVHDTVHAGVGLVGQLASSVAFGVDDELVLGSVRGRAVVGAVLGLIGDAVQDEAPALAWPTTLLRDGRPLPAGAGLPPVAPVVVLLHGLCETDDVFDLTAPGSGRSLASALAADGSTVLRVRCNSGRRPAHLGVEVDRLLVEALEGHVGPVVLVGHSMGGLVARAALRAGVRDGSDWAARCGALVTLGTPHLGAPLEKAVAVLVGSGAVAGEVEAVVRWFDQRSVGIRDLRHGADGDDGPPGVRVQAAPLPPHVRLHTVGAQLAAGVVGDAVGDGLVRRPSAHARSARQPYVARRGPTLDVDGSHFALLTSDRVLDHVRGIVADGGRSA